MPSFSRDELIDNQPASKGVSHGYSHNGWADKQAPNGLSNGVTTANGTHEDYSPTFDAVAVNGQGSNSRPIPNGSSRESTSSRTRARSGTGSSTSASIRGGRTMDYFTPMGEQPNGISGQREGDKPEYFAQANGIAYPLRGRRSPGPRSSVNGDGAASMHSVRSDLFPHPPTTSNAATALPPETLELGVASSPSKSASLAPSSLNQIPSPTKPLPQLDGAALSSTISLDYPGSSKLVHRHTLQVPKANPKRTSRDLALTNPNQSEDAIATGSKLSPTTPTVRRNSMSLVRRTTRSIHSDLHLDDVAQDEDAAKWTEAIRQKRASKRRKRDEEDEDRVIVGTKVDQHHVNWVTAYNMLTGIRFTVSRTNAKMDRELTDADFTAKHKFSFDM